MYDINYHTKLVGNLDKFRRGKRNRILRQVLENYILEVFMLITAYY